MLCGLVEDAPEFSDVSLICEAGNNRCEASYATAVARRRLIAVIATRVFGARKLRPSELDRWSMVGKHACRWMQAIDLHQGGRRHACRETIPIQVSSLRGSAIQHGRDRDVGVMKGVNGLVRTRSVYSAMSLSGSYALRVQGSHLLTLHLVHS